jgi:ElaB/YqjD/DUF883 family membrane-anchored ribosome-binding protein
MDTPKKEDHKASGTEATAAALTKDVTRLKHNVTQLSADAKAHGQAHIDAVQERFNKAVEAAKAQLAARPLAILGVGIVLGYLFGRRRHRRHTD